MTRDPSRFNDLLADRVLEGLEPVDVAELDALLATGDSSADARRTEELEEALAIAAVAGCVTGGMSLGRPPPDALLGRLQVDAAAWARQQRAALAPPAARTTTAPPSLRALPGVKQVEAEALARERIRSKQVVAAAVVGWVAAAALASFALRPRSTDAPQVVTITVPAKTAPVPAVLTPAEEREALLARGATVTRMDWSTTKDPAASEVTGDVVWSAADDKGFMRFRGLAVNDRAKLQYQLWIFDKTRDQRHPIDGGVFDVDVATGDVIVPIRAKLDVREATLFAITIEQPGGVVVSSRKRLVLAAKVPPV